MAKNINISRFYLLLVLCFIGFIFSILPPPDGVDSRAYPILGIFIALIVGILIQPYPISILCVFGLFIAFLFKIITPEEGFACFGDGVIWFVAISSIAAKAFGKTNLGRRIACFFIKKTGKSSLSLAYGLTSSELALSGFIPSNTARATCVALPLVVSISKSLGSSPENKTEKLVGQFLGLCSMYANQFTSAIFLTAMASNPMLQKFMALEGVNVSWTEWFIMASVPGLICLFAIPFFVYILCPPKMKKITNAQEIAEKQLKDMQKMKKAEIITIVIFAFMLLFWVLGDYIKIKPIVVAIGGLSALLITGVLELEDFVGAKDIWDIIIWLSILNLFALKLTEFGLIQHYTKILQIKLSVYQWPFVLLVLSLVYYFSRYIIPGNVLHACSMFPAFAKLMIVCGVPAKLGCMTLSLITAFCGFVTPYASSPCPLILNEGYITQKLWWKMGFIISFISITIWGIFGGIWWKILGYW